MVNKLGFTLAEVLIILGIIGVVAAMTIPSLMAKYQYKVLETQFKKSVSVVSQAVLKAKADYGLDNFSQYCTYYPHVAGSGKPYDNAEECYEILYKSLLNVNKQKNFYTENDKFIDRRNEIIKTYNSKQTATVSALAGIGAPIMRTYVLPDGNYVNFQINEGRLYIAVDINGARKPNKLGHDIFIFKLNSTNDALVSGTIKPKNLTDEEVEQIESENEYTKERAGNPCNLTSNQKANGIGCAYYALRDECPYNSSKKYFECLP